MITTLVVLGANGDLTGRLLLPAVAALHTAGRLDGGFRLVGAGPQDGTTADFAAHVRRRLAGHAPGLPAGTLDPVVHYRRADVTEPAEVAAVLDLAVEGGGPVAVYLALPTQVMLPAVRAVAGYGLPAGSRLAVEKPFGYDAASAAALNAELAAFDPSARQASVYRIDHVLAMTAVQSLPQGAAPGLAWSGDRIAQVELLFDETLALEGRASFYDRAGALRDVMQNHLVQILCTLAAEPGDPDDVPERRAAVLRAVRPLGADEVRASTRRARYTAGRLARTAGADGRTVPDYAAEDGVDPAHGTETFAEVVLYVDTPRWAGTRFVLRAGKALAQRRRGVLVRLRDGAGPVWIDVDIPDAEDGGAEPVAYQRIVADVLTGGSAFAVAAEEAELAWRVLTPVLDAWAADEVPLTTYPAGSAGP